MPQQYSGDPMRYMVICEGDGWWVNLMYFITGSFDHTYDYDPSIGSCRTCHYPESFHTNAAYYSGLIRGFQCRNLTNEQRTVTLGDYATSNATAYTSDPYPPGYDSSDDGGDYEANIEELGLRVQPNDLPYRLGC